MDQLKDFTKSLPTAQAFSFIEEFKAFAFKGNVIDMAVGVIIGGAFGKIVSSMVSDVMMPLIAAMSKTAGADKQDYSGLIYTLNGVEVPFGKFINEIISFLILALVLFVVIVKFVGAIMKSKKDAPPPAPTKEELLLTEIRDLLKKQVS